MSRNYILDRDHKAVAEDDLMTWAKWFEDADRTVARESVGDLEISTVFLGIDHGFGTEGEPVLFETMVFGDEDEEEACERYATWEQAKKGHRRFVAKAREKK